MAGNVRTDAFYSIGPEDETKPLSFSADSVLARIAGLNREAGEAYLPTGMYDRYMGLIYGQHEPHPVLALYWVDTANPPEYEFKGEIETREFMDGEGMAHASYAMFFEDRVMALLRPLQRSAGPSGFSGYINHFCKVNCSFDALPNPAVLKQLQRPGEEVLSARVRIKMPYVASVERTNKDVADALRAADAPTRSTEITVTWKARLLKERAAWWSRTKPLMTDLVKSGAIDSFESAVINMTGGPPVDLLKHHLTTRVEVDVLKGEKGVKPGAAAVALATAYERTRESLAEALQSLGQ